LNGKDKIYLSIKVQARARKPGLEKVSSGEYKIRVSAPPSRGEANREVVETLASHFGLPPSRVKIVRGQKSQRKLVLLEMNNSM
jgi:uncharacterized protein (TIGR00251 family)